jgi:predicted MFS family arabinose efflux permease
MVGMMNMLSAAAFATFVLFIQDVLNLNSTEYGFLRTSGAIGGLVGTLVASGIIRRLGAGHALFGAFLINAATLAVIAVFPVPVFVGAMLALSALTAVVWNIITVSFRQAIVPEQLLGRVNSAYRLLASGGTSLGALLGGFLTRSFGLITPFWIAAVVLGVTAFAALPIVNERTLREAREDMVQETA